MEKQPVTNDQISKYFKKKERLPTILETADGIIDEALDEQEISRRMEELDKEYKRTEYNCHKQHHDNPKTRNKLKALLSGNLY